ncbi:MAG: WD40 repeat domain-containing protein [Spirochaetales bacterium]|nr:WD40 repeat domain-containing protein [Spirochaetales bacterium]
MKNWHFVLLVIFLLLNIFACTTGKSHSNLIDTLEGFHLKETNTPTIKPIVLDAKKLKDFSYNEDSSLNWFPIGYRGLTVIDRETGRRKEPEIGYDFNTLLVSVYLADKENNILFIQSYETVNSDTEYVIYDFNKDKNIVSKIIDDPIRFIPFEPGKMLVMDKTGSWYFSDYELIAKTTNKLTDELTRQIIRISGKREVRHLSPDMWDELSQSDLFDLSFINEPIQDNTLNIEKRMMFGERRDLSWTHPTFVSIYWDDSINNVRIEPVYKQRAGDLQVLDRFIFSADGNWAKWEASSFDKNYRDYVPELYFHLVGDEHPQKISMPVYGGTFATKSLEEKIDDGSFSDPARASEYVRGEFLYHDDYGACFVCYNLLNEGYLLVYPYDEIVRTYLSGKDNPKEENKKQLEKLTHYNMARNGTLAYRFLLFKQEFEFYKIINFKTLEADFWSASMPEPTSAAFLSSDGLHLLAIEEAGRLSLWNVLLDKKEIHIIKRWQPELSLITTAVFSPVNNFFVTGTKNGTVTFWDMEGNKLSEFKASTEHINSFYISEDGKYILIGYKNHIPQLWETGGVKISDLEIKDIKYKRLAHFEFGKNALYIAQEEIGIHKFDLKGRLIHTLYSKHNYNITHFSISDDETEIAIWENYYDLFLILDSTGSMASFHNKPWIICKDNWDQTVTLWSKHEQLEKEIILNNRYGFNQITLSNDGTFYACGQENKLIILDSTYDPIYVSEEQSAYISHVAIAPDSRHIAAVDAEGTAFMWEITGNEINKYTLPKITSPQGIGFNNSSTELVMWSHNQIIASDIMGNILTSFETKEKSEKIAGVDYNSLYYVIKGTVHPVIKKLDDSDFSYIIEKIENGYVEDLRSEDYICRVFFSNDSEKLLLVSNFDKVYLFMMKTKNLIPTAIPVNMSDALYYAVSTPKAVNANILKNPIMLSPSGKFIFSYSTKSHEGNPDVYIGQNTVYSWNGDPVLHIESALNLGSAIFSYNEKFLITASGNRIKYWNISN